MSLVFYRVYINQLTGKYLMDMSFSSKAPALQPGWIKSHHHAMVRFFCTSFAAPSSVILIDGHGTLLASLKRNGAVGASVLSFGHSFNHRVADLVSDERYQDELAFKFAPGPIL